MDWTAQNRTHPPLPDGMDDTFARTIEWDPLKSGGTNFRTHRLVEVSPDCHAFRGTVGLYLFFGLFLAIGLGVIALFVWQGDFSFGSILFLLLFGGVFSAVGLYGFRSGLQAPVFDRVQGWWWKGRDHRQASRDDKGMLQDIYALQLLTEIVEGDESTYPSYELNLVLTDGTRRNLVDHGKLAPLRTEAETLARFLGVPLWDATSRGDTLQVYTPPA